MFVTILLPTKTLIAVVHSMHMLKCGAGPTLFVIFFASRWHLRKKHRVWGRKTSIVLLDSQQCPIYLYHRFRRRKSSLHNWATTLSTNTVNMVLHILYLLKLSLNIDLKIARKKQQWRGGSILSHPDIWLLGWVLTSFIFPIIGSHWPPGGCRNRNDQ